MPNYWLLVVSEENYIVIRDRLVYGAPATARRDIRRLIRPGDILFFYISRRGSRRLGGRIAGAYRVASDWFEDNTPLWPDEAKEGRALYPYRVKIEPVIDCSEGEPPPLQELVPKLGFIAKKERWQAYLVGTPANAGRPLPLEDAERILRALRERCREG